MEARDYFRGPRRTTRAKDMSPEACEARAWWNARKNAQAALHLTARAEGWSNAARYHAGRAVRNQWACATVALLHALLGGAS